MMTRRARATDSPTYDPAVERRPSPWNSLDTGMQRFVAVAGALGLIVTVCAWAANTIALDERIAKVEAEQAETRDLARANLAVTCILVRKVDATLEPSQCRGK